MKFVYRVRWLSMLFACPFAYGQEPTKPTSEVRPSLELKLAKPPLWKGKYLQLSVQRTNISKSSVFLDVRYGGIKVFCSVNDAPNTSKQSHEKWMLVYGWTDVISESIRVAAGVSRKDSISIFETFPIKETGKESRQVRVQGKLRIVAAYQTPSSRIIDQTLGKGRRIYSQVEDDPNRWTLSQVLLEIPIPCPKDINTPDCLSPPQIFPGEHDVHELEIVPPTLTVD